MTVYLVPVRRDHFEIYSEPAEEAERSLDPGTGRLRRWAHAANLQWHEMVDTARLGQATGRLAKWRDRIVCRLAETIAEQRTLWALRKSTHATLLFPSSMDAGSARSTLDRVLAAARRHH